MNKRSHIQNEYLAGNRLGTAVLLLTAFFSAVVLRWRRRLVALPTTYPPRDGND